MSSSQDFLLHWVSSKLPSWLRLPPRATARHIFYGIIIGFSLSLTSTSIALWYQERKQERLSKQFEARPIELRSDEILNGVTGLIGVHCSGFQRIEVHEYAGNTPLVRINSLSDALGVEILGKAEVGTSGDRSCEPCMLT